MGSLSDLTEAADTAAVLSGDREAFAPGRECQREASALLERDWRTIIALAEQLVDAPAGVLDGDRVGELVRRVDQMSRH